MKRKYREGDRIYHKDAGKGYIAYSGTVDQDYPIPRYAVDMDNKSSFICFEDELSPLDSNDMPPCAVCGQFSSNSYEAPCSECGSS